MGKIQSAFFSYHIPVLGHFRNQWRQLGEVGSGIQQAVNIRAYLAREIGALKDDLGLMLP